MKQFAVYTFLQLKRVFKSFMRMFAILLMCALTTALIFWGVCRILKAEEISLVRIGLVIPEEETTSKYVTDMISKAESVKSICSFEYCSYEEAKEGFENMKLEAVVVLPQGFYHDVQVGLNPPAVIYVRENPTVSGKLFRELLADATAYIGIAESGVYSVIDISRDYESVIPENNLGNTVALKYTDKIFNRSDMFRERKVSSRGIVDSDSFMVCSGLIVILVYFGTGFFVMYGRENKSVLEKLKVNGMGPLACALSKVLVMTVYIFIAGTGIAAIATRGSLSGDFWPVMGLLSITMGLYFEIIFETVGDGKKGVFVLIVVNTIGIICSGMIIPKAFLQSYVVTAGRIFPFGYWQELLLGAVKGGLK